MEEDRPGSFSIKNVSKEHLKTWLIRRTARRRSYSNLTSESPGDGLGSAEFNGHQDDFLVGVNQLFLPLTFMGSLVENKQLNLLGGSSTVFLDVIERFMRQSFEHDRNSKLLGLLVELITSIDDVLLVEEERYQLNQNISEALNHLRTYLEKQNECRLERSSNTSSSLSLKKHDSNLSSCASWIIGLSSDSELEERPPSLPPKKDKDALRETIRRHRNESPYDNVDYSDSDEESPPPLPPKKNDLISQYILIMNQAKFNNNEKPPLPPKVKRGGVNSRDYKLIISKNEVKGGTVLSLITHALDQGSSESKFLETFLTTWRTFTNAKTILENLWSRFQATNPKPVGLGERIFKGACSSSLKKNDALELWLNVTKTLTPMDLDADIVTRMREWIYELITTGNISSAAKAREALIDKFQKRKRLLTVTNGIKHTTVLSTLLDWSSVAIAEQLTLLDSELFSQLEVGELLIWAEDQDEHSCPTLTRFTAQFNKISMWARTLILRGESRRIRLQRMKKLVHTMKRLREMNNFNSILALLAALDSGPIKRLFGRSFEETLKPYMALIDSSYSFKNYRTALNESQPPCIPFIGLILQDLTFVHSGNNDYLDSEDVKLVNWTKRSQQWNVLEPIRKFQSISYRIQRNEMLINFIDDFDEVLTEEELWNLSENIKPRKHTY